MRTAFLFYLLLLGTCVSAEEIETVIVPPPSPVVAGQEAVFSVLFLNSGEEPIHLTFPDSPLFRLTSSNSQLEVTAKITSTTLSSAMVVGKGNYTRVKYVFTIPEGIKGPTGLDADAFNAAPVMFTVSPPPPPDTASKETTVSGTEKYRSFETLFSLYQRYLVNLSAYEPMYFLVGTEPKNSKFQISLKYQFFNDNHPLAQEHPWVKGIHMGYTQTSFWDLESDSIPFRDTSYKPELFFLTDNLRARPSALTGFFFQSGFQHESNGRSGDTSRSTNFLYVKPIFTLFNEKDRYGFQISPKIWTYVKNEDETNSDLDDYRGYFDLELKAGLAESFVLSSNFRWANEGTSIQLDLTYPLNQYFFKNLDFYLQIQYVNSLAETLLNYRHRTEALRFGFSIVR